MIRDSFFKALKDTSLRELFPEMSELKQIPLEFTLNRFYDIIKN